MLAEVSFYDDFKVVSFFNMKKMNYDNIEFDSIDEMLAIKVDDGRTIEELIETRMKLLLISDITLKWRKFNVRELT